MNKKKQFSHPHTYKEDLVKHNRLYKLKNGLHFEKILDFVANLFCRYNKLLIRNI